MSDIKVKTLGIGCDHLGLEMKNAIRDHLKSQGIEVVDMGVNSEDPVDYPDIGANLARELSRGKFERGILVCGTGAGMAMGSPSYIAPERLWGKPHDARSDLYAVGVVLYEMIAGIKPFLGATPEEIMNAVMTRPPRPLRVLAPDVSPALEAVIRCALAKDPDRRFPDAEAMLSALADVEALDAAIADQRESPAEIGEREEHEPNASMTMLQLSLSRPTIWQRIWSWLRYGRWRWRPDH